MATACMAGAITAGALGADWRWLGAFVLSELAATTGLRRSCWLAALPWARVGVRLVAPAAALFVLGLAMPSARVVGPLFLLEGIGGLGWVALCLVAGHDLVRLRPALEAFGAVGTVGLCSSLVPSSSTSGWAPVAAVVVTLSVLSTSRRAPTVEES